MQYFWKAVLLLIEELFWELRETKYFFGSSLFGTENVPVGKNSSWLKPPLGRIIGNSQLNQFLAGFFKGLLGQP